MRKLLGAAAALAVMSAAPAVAATWKIDFEFTGNFTGTVQTVTGSLSYTDTGDTTGSTLGATRDLDVIDFSLSGLYANGVPTIWDETNTVAKYGTLNNRVTVFEIRPDLVAEGLVADGNDFQLFFRNYYTGPEDLFDGVLDPNGDFCRTLQYVECANEIGRDIPNSPAFIYTYGPGAFTITDVTDLQPPPPAVPLPAAGWLLAAGLGALALQRRKPA